MDPKENQSFLSVPHLSGLGRMCLTNAAHQLCHRTGVPAVSQDFWREKKNFPGYWARI